MTMHKPIARQRGMAMVIGMIMLVLLTLLVVSAINSSSVNLRITGNMQAQDEARAMAQQAIERVLGVKANFYPTPTAQAATNYYADNNSSGNAVYSVVGRGTGVQGRREAISRPYGRLHQRCARGPLLLGHAVGSRRDRDRCQDRRAAGDHARRCHSVRAGIQPGDGELLGNECQPGIDMKTTTATRLLLTCMLATAASTSFAEDIDIYSQNTSITPGAPNVLIVMDNTANWSQSFASSNKFAAEKLALAQVINALKTQFNLGLMMFTETGSPNNNTDGGYVRFAIQPMTDANGNPTNARNCLLTMIGATPTTPCVSDGLPITYYSNLDINPDDKSNGGKGGVTMGEAYKYFAGANAYAGNDKVKADPRGFISQTHRRAARTSLRPATGCQKNFIIVHQQRTVLGQRVRHVNGHVAARAAGGSSARDGDQPARQRHQQQQRSGRMDAVPEQGSDGPGDHLYARSRAGDERRRALQHGVAAKHGSARQRRLLFGNRRGDAEHGAHPNLQRHPGRQQRVRVVELAAVRRQHG